MHVDYVHCWPQVGQAFQPRARLGESLFCVGDWGRVVETEAMLATERAGMGGAVALAVTLLAAAAATAAARSVVQEGGEVRCGAAPDGS